MNTQALGSSTESALPPRKKRRRLWLAGIVAFLVLSYFIPLLGYLARLTDSVIDHGLSRKTLTSFARHTDWFKRYFTGPPSDAEMIAHFRAHRADLERLAYLFAMQGHCSHREREQPNQECARIERRVGMSSGMEGTSLLNSVFRNPRSHTCDFPCYVQDYNFTLKERQQWWRTKNSDIEAWDKELVYVPPLLPAERFGLDPKGYPTDPIEIMRRSCYGNLVASLDMMFAHLEQDPGNWGYPNCVARHIDGQWFIKLRPVVSPP